MMSCAAAQGRIAAIASTLRATNANSTNMAAAGQRLSNTVAPE